MKKTTSKGPCFALTLPIHCENWQRDKLDTIFIAANFLKNQLIADRRHALEQMMRLRSWKAVQEGLREGYAIKATKAEMEVLLAQRGRLLKGYGFSEYAFQARIQKWRRHYKKLVGTHIAQKIASSVWKSFEARLFGNGEDIHFSKWTEFTCIEGKSNEANLVYRDGLLKIAGMSLPVKLDRKDKYNYQTEALSRTLRFCKIVRRWYPTGWRYFAQLILDGEPPIKVIPETGELLHPLGTGRVGHDIGLQTLASCGTRDVSLVELVDKAQDLQDQLRRINRAMDRSRRATNPALFDSAGRIVVKDKLPPHCLGTSGYRQWACSKRYLELAATRRYLYRKQANLRVQQHHELVNRLLAYGDEHYIESMRFRALAKRANEAKKSKSGKNLSRKRFGKSIANKAPALFVKILENAVMRVGGSLQEINTCKARASQYNHLDRQYIKKSLSTRWNYMPDGKKIQRDLYSAFLIGNISEDLETFDQALCDNAYENFTRLHDAEISRLQSISTPSSTGVRKSA